MPFSSLIIVLAIVLIFMGILWLIQIRSGEADIVDLGWTTSVAICAVFFAVLGNGELTRRILIASLVSIWAIRLSYLLYSTRVSKSGEDGRYKLLRESWGERAQINFLIFFMAQGFLAFVLALPFLAVSVDPNRIASVFDWLGILLFATAFLGESISDQQLAKFRLNPKNKGKTCRAGLWRYSRHPNYFFEWLHWISYSFIAFSSPLWYLALFSPLIMLYLIIFVTGIPPAEDQALKSRGDDYREYQKSTSAFVPWFPKI